MSFSIPRRPCPYGAADAHVVVNSRATRRPVSEGSVPDDDEAVDAGFGAPGLAGTAEHLADGGVRAI